ncbi:diphthine synthase [Tyrophagus putrescentiae]|nr:diphthine synthase [Tyrophagus putrescentiae]
MLYLIGLGLGDKTDITVKGLEIVKRSKRVYLEIYTSILGDDHKELEGFYGRSVIPADREFVEINADEILSGADVDDIAFLVVGDPLGATTHTDLILRAKERKIDYRLVHNASIINACGACGLQLYNFGEVVSIPLWTDSWKPTSYVEKICQNLKANLHTLCLLDIKVKEQSIEAMMKGKKEYLPPTFMSASVASQQLIDSIQELPELCAAVNLSEDSTCVALARVGGESQKIHKCTLKEMLQVDMGPPLHSLIVVGKLHPIEEDMLKLFE